MTPRLDETLLRSATYEILSLAFLYPDEAAIQTLRDGAEKLSDHSGVAGWDGMSSVLAALATKLERADFEILEREHTEIFGHTISTDCAPYEAEYGQAHVFQKSQAMADLSTFYGAFGLQVSPDLKDRLDHISVEMEFMHFLALKEARGHANGDGDDRVLLCRQAQEGFLTHHLAEWILVFAQRLARKAPTDGVYSTLARLLDTHMAMEFQRFNLDATSPDASHQYEDESPDQEEECGDVLAPSSVGEGEAVAR